MVVTHSGVQCVMSEFGCDSDTVRQDVSQGIDISDLIKLIPFCFGQHRRATTTSNANQGSIIAKHSAAAGTKDRVSVGMPHAVRGV